MKTTIGYARTSTLDQQAGFDAQVRELEAAGCERVFSEKVSSVADRPQLSAALDYLRSGDVFVVTKLDRLARSTAHLLQIVEAVRSKGAALRILNLGIDTDCATGKLMLTVIGAIAAFEREMMLERQREGIAAAKAAGKYKGRKPTVRAQEPEIRALHAQGVSNAEIARRIGAHPSNVGRVLKR